MGRSISSVTLTWRVISISPMIRGTCAEKQRRMKRIVPQILSMINTTGTRTSFLPPSSANWTDWLDNKWRCSETWKNSHKKCNQGCHQNFWHFSCNENFKIFSLLTITVLSYSFLFSFLLVIIWILKQCLHLYFLSLFLLNFVSYSIYC